MRLAVLIVVVLALAVAAPAPAAPSFATPSCTPAPTDCSGWYRSNVKLTWTFQPTVEATRNCDWDTFEAEGINIQPCEVRVAGQWVPSPVRLRIDKTAPTVTGTAPSRGPDANGWYRSPVDVKFFGTDLVPGIDTSGVAGCSSGTYGGPDAASAEVLGTCWDHAGNVSAPGSFALRYDSTAPTVAKVDADPGDRVVRLRWAVSDAATVEVWRSPGRADAAQVLLDTRPDGTVEDDGLRNGRRYAYRVRAVDAAGNAATKVFSVVPGRRLLAPARGARVDAPPLLRWTEARGASYYNVQLFRGRRKILSAWPTRPRLQLERSWRYGGKQLTLKPGRYRWLVWPGQGPRSKNDYGPLIGRRTFTVAP
jgi:hypothetical protein